MKVVFVWVLVIYSVFGGIYVLVLKVFIVFVILLFLRLEDIKKLSKYFKIIRRDYRDLYD